MDKLEELIHNDLQQYLLSVNEIDERLPECPDVEGKWETIANAYIPDGVREFQNYPLASLGWMMYIGMAVAKMWDDDWQYYAAKEDLYLYLRTNAVMMPWTSMSAGTYSNFRPRTLLRPKNLSASVLRGFITR